MFFLIREIVVKEFNSSFNIIPLYHEENWLFSTNTSL